MSTDYQILIQKFNNLQKMINKMKSLKSVDSTKVAMDKLNAKPMNENLKQNTMTI